MSVSEFIINFILSPELVVEKEKLSEDFFVPGIEQVDYFKNATLEKNEPLTELDKHYIEAHDYSKEVLQYAQLSSTVELTPDGIKFSFAIKNVSDNFVQKNEQGQRIWLRQYLDDHILHYTLPAMLEKSFNWKKDLTALECEKFEKLHEAFKLALSQAYDNNNKTFNIIGE